MFLGLKNQKLLDQTFRWFVLVANLSVSVGSNSFEWCVSTKYDKFGSTPQTQDWSHHQNENIFGLGDPLETFICHCYWGMGRSKWYKLFKGTPLSNTTNGWVIRTLSTTTLEIGVPNPGCFAMDFPSINHRHTSAIFMLKALRIWKLPIFSERSSCIISVNMWDHFHSTKDG